MNKLDALLDFNATALRVRAQRQEILAANIANADTPNFKARDIDFAASLKRALEDKSTKMGSTTESNPNSGLEMATSSTKHMSKNGGINEADLLFRPLIQGSVDGNSVDGEVERTAYVENAIKYEANITMLNASIQGMKAALSPIN